MSGGAQLDRGVDHSDWGIGDRKQNRDRWTLS